MNLTGGFKQMKNLSAQKTTQQSNCSNVWHIRRGPHFNDCFGRRYAALFFVGQPSPPERKRHRQKPKQPTAFGRKNVVLGRKTISGFHHQIENFISKDKSHHRVENKLVASHTHAGYLFHFYFGELTQSGSAIELRRHHPEGRADAQSDKKAEGINHF